MIISSLVLRSFPGGYFAGIDDRGVDHVVGLLLARTISILDAAHHRHCSFRKDENVGFAKRGQGANLAFSCSIVE
jgi:hypothetical protein